MTDCPACTDVNAGKLVTVYGACVVCGFSPKATYKHQIYDEVAACYRLGGLGAIYDFALTATHEHTGLIERLDRYLAHLSRRTSSAYPRRL